LRCDARRRLPAGDPPKAAIRKTHKLLAKPLRYFFFFAFFLDAFFAVFFFAFAIILPPPFAVY